MGKLKYVIIRSEGSLKPILFDPLLEFRRPLRNHKVESAGFVGIHADGDEVCVQTWGKSTTLGIVSKPTDADIIKRVLDRNY